MSFTKFQARKQAYSQDTTQDEGQEKVAWEYTADLDTMELSISNRSGGVKINVGANRRNPFLYANEIIAILDKADEIRRYLADHPQAKDTPPSKKQQAAMSLLDAQVQAAKNAQVVAMTKSMREAGLSEDIITLALSKVK